MAGLHPLSLQACSCQGSICCGCHVGKCAHPPLTVHGWDMTARRPWRVYSCDCGAVRRDLTRAPHCWLEPVLPSQRLLRFWTDRKASAGHSSQRMPRRGCAQLLRQLGKAGGKATCAASFRCQIAPAGSCCSSTQAVLNEVNGELEGGQGIGWQVQNAPLLPDGLQHRRR